MYEVLPSFILGFHGCDASVAEQVFAGEEGLSPSENDYDWLGHGIYFWEHNPQRALEYAQMLRDRPQRGKGYVRRPAVVGAVIDLGFCLNLLDAHFLATIKSGYEALRQLSEQAGESMPVNKPAGSDGELLLRHLDCAVLQTVHELREEAGQTSFDTTRGVFVEGRPLYPNAGFHERNHIQVCVRNRRCIKGYFRPLNNSDGFAADSTADH